MFVAKLPALHMAVFRFSQPLDGRMAHVYHAYYGTIEKLGALHFRNMEPVGEPVLIPY